MKKSAFFLITALFAAMTTASVMFLNCASNAKTSTAAPSGASGGSKTKYVAVVETEIDAQSGAAAELNPADARQITAALRREAVENLPRGTYHIITTETVLSMGGAVLEECSDENCVVTLGAKIGADYIVRGIISKIGTKFTLSAEMYETDNGTLVASSEYVRADNAAELMDKTVAASANMFRKFVNPNWVAPAKKEKQTAAYTAPAAPPPPQSAAAARQPVNNEAAPTYQPSDADGFGTLTDNRDGKKYKTVTIAGKKWTAENLNINRGRSWCYENDDSNCGQYGRLYDWNTAKTVCMAGWHLPSRQEWQGLVIHAGGYNNAGKKLKAKSGWDSDGNGTDEYGWSALPVGTRYPDGGFHFASYLGYWWTSTEIGDGSAYYRYMYYEVDGVVEHYQDKGFGLAVRCVQD